MRPQGIFIGVSSASCFFYDGDLNHFFSDTFCAITVFGYRQVSVNAQAGNIKGRFPESFRTGIIMPLLSIKCCC